jgi:hypothetical protein
MAILTGGVYQTGLVGVEGITRETTPGAFVNGYLQPCALVRQRSATPDLQIRDDILQETSITQVVEIYLYEDRGYTAIDAASAELYLLFQGVMLPAAYPCEWIGLIDRQRDAGALKGKSLARMEFLVRSIYPPPPPAGRLDFSQAAQSGLLGVF